MPSIISVIANIVSEAFAAEGLPGDFGQVEISNQPGTQFQCNGAMRAAKLLQQPSRKISELILNRLVENKYLTQVTVAGPGFLNINVTDDFLAKHINIVFEDDRLGCPLVKSPRTVVLDYGGPNVAKAMHVGHLRSAIIGDSLRRIFSFVGDHVTSDIHLGDWGLPMGMLIVELERQQPELPYFDPDNSGPFPETSPATISDLEYLYPRAAERCKQNIETLQKAREATNALQLGRPGYHALWQHFVNISKAEIKPTFSDINVEFDLWHGESAVNDLISPMIDGFLKTSVAKESDGAIIAPVTSNEGETELPPLILRKSDGAVTYGATDLATIIHRCENLSPDLILYIVDQRQKLHFEQVFRVAKKIEKNGKTLLEHIGFGTVNGKDGKPYKTRDGGVMKLQDLIAMSIEAATKRIDQAGLAQKLNIHERTKVATQVAIASLRFADLCNHRLSNYVFDLEKFTNFQGKTGPYLLYATVRMQSLLRKGENMGLRPGRILSPDHIERDLILTLAQLPDVLFAAYRRRSPNELCEFSYRLAQIFNRFYESCHIFGEADDDLKTSRLALTKLTFDELVLVLSLIGVTVPKHM